MTGGSSWRELTVESVGRLGEQIGATFGGVGVRLALGQERSHLIAELFVEQSQPLGLQKPGRLL